MRSDKIDKAIFLQLGKQIYACSFFKDGVLVGNMNDTHGTFIHEVKKHLEEEYPSIVIEVK
jgi:hypothetical protein